MGISKERKTAAAGLGKLEEPMGVGDSSSGAESVQDVSPAFLMFKEMMRNLDEKVRGGELAFKWYTDLETEDKTPKLLEVLRGWNETSGLIKDPGEGFEKFDKRWRGPRGKHIYSNNRILFRKDEPVGCYPFNTRIERESLEKVAIAEGSFVPEKFRGEGFGNILVIDGIVMLIEMKVDKFLVGAAHETSLNEANQKIIGRFEQVFPDAVKVNRKEGPGGKQVIVSGEIDIVSIDRTLTEHNVVRPPQ